MNTIINTVVTTLVQIVFCSMAGYAFGRIEFPFKNAIFILVLSVLMVPGQIFLLPQYQIVQKLGLPDYDSGTVSAKPVPARSVLSY